MTWIEKAYDEERAAHPDVVILQIHTRVPSKWRITDRETGQVWRWDEQKQVWKLATEGM